MVTLADFLLARVAEDEIAVAQAVRDGDPWCYSDPARVLAECEAKRRIIATSYSVGAMWDSEWGCGHSAEQIRDGKCERNTDTSEWGPDALAEVYSDHPDYDERWRWMP